MEQPPNLLGLVLCVVMAHLGFLMAANTSHFVDSSGDKILKEEALHLSQPSVISIINSSLSLMSSHSQIVASISPSMNVINSNLAHTVQNIDLMSTYPSVLSSTNSSLFSSVITSAAESHNDNRKSVFLELEEDRRHYAKSKEDALRHPLNLNLTLESLKDYLLDNETFSYFHHDPPLEGMDEKILANISFSNFEDDLASFIAEQEREESFLRHPELSHHPIEPLTSAPNLASNTAIPSIAVSTAVSTSTSTRIFARSSNRKTDRKQAGFQDIISGLVKLLGGKNVHIANAKVSGNGNSSGNAPAAPSRINHRAPPKLNFAEPAVPPQPSSASPSVTSSTDQTWPSMEEIRPSSTGDISMLATKDPQGSSTSRPSSTIENTHFSIEPSQPMSDSSTVGPPSGPITEWLPALGYPIGHRDSSKSSKPSIEPSSSSSPSTTTLPMTAMDVTKTMSKEVISTAETTKDNLNGLQHPETEVSYAEVAPTITSASSDQTSTKKVTATYPSENLTNGQTSSSTANVTPPLPSIKVQSAQKPSIGTILEMPKPTTTSSKDPETDVGSTEALMPSKEPTGSPFVIPVDIQQIRLGQELEAGPILNHPGRPTTEQSVYIDGRKTFFNLMPTETKSGGGDSTLVNVGIGYSFPTGEKPPISHGSVSNVRLPAPQRPANRPQTERNPQVHNKTPIRIDTCIIGDETACNVQLNETCRVEAGVSSCNCKLGYGRDGLEQGCKPVVGLVVYIKVDRVNNEQISFGPEYQSPSSEKYEILEYESKIAVDSVFSLSALAESFAGSAINGFFSVGGKVIINATINLLESPQTRSPTIKQEIRRGLISVIRQQNQNIGQSRLYIDGPLNPIPGVQDLDECTDPYLNDCSKHAVCTNTFGSYKCACLEGFMDKYAEDSRKSGRTCTVCSPQYCNNKGECVITNGQKECRCHGNYIGAKCETDGEVLGVALGASLAALVIIVLTLICLCMWSRRWKRDQQKILGNTSGGLGNNYSYFNKASVQADFHLPMEDRIRWPQTVDPMDNFYAQPDPIIPGPNPRAFNSSRPPLPTSPPPSNTHKALQPLRSLPAPLTSSRSNILDDTDEDDQGNYDPNTARFHFPRPKSRVSQTGHNNIYYDVSFPNNRDQYGYDKDYGNAFPMKNMRPFHS